MGCLSFNSLERQSAGQKNVIITMKMEIVAKVKWNQFLKTDPAWQG